MEDIVDRLYDGIEEYVMATKFKNAEEYVKYAAEERGIHNMAAYNDREIMVFKDVDNINEIEESYGMRKGYEDGNRYEGLAKEQKNVVDFYEKKVLPYAEKFAKQKGNSFEYVEADDGRRLKIEVNERDKMEPIMAYQRKDSVEGLNEANNIENLGKNDIIQKDLDFTQAGSFARFRKKDANYMITSAENPMGKQATKAMNKKTHKAFGEFMTENGIEHKAQLGMYDNPENSYIIKIETPEQRKMIDKWLEENSPQAENIIIKDGKAVRYNPRTKEAHSVELSKAKELTVDNNAKNYYSEIDGRKYQLPLYNEELENPISIKELNDLYNN